MRDSFQELLGSMNPATCGHSLPAVLFGEQNEAGLAGLLTGFGLRFLWLSFLSTPFVSAAHNMLLLTIRHLWFWPAQILPQFYLLAANRAHSNQAGLLLARLVLG